MRRFAICLGLGVCLHATADEPAAPGHLDVGPAYYLTSSYPGARSTRSLPLPFVDAEFGRFYSNASDVLGVYAYKTDATQIGSAVEYDLTERRARDDESLRGLRDVKETPRLKLFASQTYSFITVDSNVATDVAGHGQGTLAQGNLWFTMPFIPKCLISVGPGVTAGDSRYMTTFFGISPTQARSSKFTEYQARAGAVDFHWNGLQTLQASSRWSIGASEYLARLRGSAVGSPVVETRRQIVFLAWLAYKVR